MRTKYTDKLERMATHLAKHPNDYQTVISFLKTRSKNFDEQSHIVRIQKIKELQRYKKGWQHGK